MNTTGWSGRLQERDPGVLAWIRMARIHARVQALTADRLRAHDLTIAQFDVIAQVGGNEGMTQQELAGALLVTKGNVTQLLDRLEARGLIERRTEPGRRGNRLYLTDAGWRLNRAAVPEHEALVRDLFAGLSGDNARTMNRLLRQLDRSLDERMSQENPE